MPRGTSARTRQRIISAADELFYADGIRSASVDAVAERAGITKRTLYYHFPSKDELIRAYLEARDLPTLERMKHVIGAGDLLQGVASLFDVIEKLSTNRKWKGCAFLRAIHELAGMPGHPALAIARQHKRAFEDWLGERSAPLAFPMPGSVRDNSSSSWMAQSPKRWFTAIRHTRRPGRSSLYGFWTVGTKRVLALGCALEPAPHGGAPGRRV
jgi:AcrR family transcriptional regulator